jgi:glycosyltransferase involved in cell wall biosynthesis
LTKKDNSHVTVVVPTLNEEENIAGVIHELNQMGYCNILVVDGNSVDKTVEVAEELGVSILVQNEKGKGAALRQAFNHDGLDGDVVVMMDADGSMSPKEIPLFIEALDSGADLAKGSRFLAFGYSEDMNLIRRIGNLFFISLVNWLCFANYTDLCYGFAAFRKDAIKKLIPHLKSINFEIEAEIFVKAKKLGMNVTEVPSIELRRRHGKSNLNALRDGIRIFKTIIEEVFTDVRQE